MTDFSERIAAIRSANAAFSLIELDIAGEKASSLGHQGRQTEKALAALRAHDAAGKPRDAARLALVKAAAREVWSFFVLREACGLRDQHVIIKDYAIPGEVLVRLGAFD